MALEEVAQPADRVGVQVVGGLVQQQGAGLAGRVGEQDAGQLDAPPLAAGQGAQRLGQHPLGQPQVGADPSGLGLAGIAAECGEALFQLPVPADQRLVGMLLGQPVADRGQLAQQAVQPTRRQHPVGGGLGQVAGTRVLRQVAHSPAAAHRAGMRQRFAGQHLQGGGLAGSVPADQADPVAGLHPERGGLEQDASARAQFQIGGGDHDGLSVSGGLGRAASDQSGTVPMRFRLPYWQGVTLAVVVRPAIRELLGSAVCCAGTGTE